jgi:hypothetical protein
LVLRPEVGGRIVKVGRVAWIQHAPVLKAMMEHLWSLRDKTNPNYDPGMDMLGKLLGNSTYGKFGMSPDKEEIVFSRPGKLRKVENEMGEQIGTVHQCKLCENEIPMGSRLCHDCKGSKVAGRKNLGVWFKARKVTAPYIIPQIAAHITTIARIRLWEYMVMASKRSCVVVEGKIDASIRKEVA